MDSNLEARRPRWYRRRWGIALLTLVGALAIAVPVAWASDVFDDVPTTNPFHNDINAIKAAGITQGCSISPPLYCPSDNVTREAMAAFMHRGFGRAGRTHVLSTALTSTPTAKASVSLTVPGGAGSTVNGFVLVQAAGVPYVSSGCPCEVWMRVSDPVSGQASWYMIEDVQPAGYTGSQTDTYLFPVTATAGTTRQFNVDAFLAVGSGTVQIYVDATALWVPFGSTGGSTLGGVTSGAQQTSSGR